MNPRARSLPLRLPTAGVPWRAAIRLLVLAAFAMVCAAASAASPDRGQDLYAKHCAHCHGATGRPVWPGTPDFKRSPVLLRPDAQLIASIRRGKGVMPAYEGLLRERELLDLVAYLRTLH